MSDEPTTPTLEPSSDPAQFQALIDRLIRWSDDIAFVERMAEERRAVRRRKRAGIEAGESIQQIAKDLELSEEIIRPIAEGLGLAVGAPA